MVVSWIRRLPERSVSPTVWDGGGQTGSFPFFEVSSHHEPSESCETNIRKRPVCPRFPRLSPVPKDERVGHSHRRVARRIDLCSTRLISDMLLLRTDEM